MQRVYWTGRRWLKPVTVALASALAIGSVRRARQKSYREGVSFAPDTRPSGGGPRGFVATLEDKSNDRGFVATVEDKSNDTGFRQQYPVRTPEADPPASSPATLATPTEPAASHPVPHDAGDPPTDL